MTNILSLYDIDHSYSKKPEEWSIDIRYLFYYLVFLKWGLQQGQNSIILPEISEVGNPKKFLSRGFEEG